MKIHQIKGYIQTIYLVENDGHFLLLDGCCRCDVLVVKSFIEDELASDFSKLKLVITTHAHPDHSGGLTEFQKFGIKVAGPIKLNDWYKGFSGFLTYQIDILLTYLVALNKKRGFKNIFFPRKTKLDFILKEGEVIPGFEDWKVIECPGHTSMDISLHHSDLSLAYVADNFVGNSKNVFRPYPIVYPDLYKNSLKRYIDLGVTRFLIAHHGEVKISQDRINELIETTPVKPRKHTNTLFGIFMKLLKSFIRKF